MCVSAIGVRAMSAVSWLGGGGRGVGRSFTTGGRGEGMKITTNIHEEKKKGWSTLEQSHALACDARNKKHNRNNMATYMYRTILVTEGILFQCQPARTSHQSIITQSSAQSHHHQLDQARLRRIDTRSCHSSHSARPSSVSASASSVGRSSGDVLSRPRAWRRTWKPVVLFL